MRFLFKYLRIAVFGTLNHPYAFGALGMFLLADTLFLGAAIGTGGMVDAFHLDREQNFPTYYQAFKLVLLGCTIFSSAFLARLLRQGPFFSLLPYSFGFIYIALDEIGQIHETVPERLAEVFPIAVTNYQEFLFSIGFSSAYWLLFYLPFLVVAPFYLLYIAKQYVHTRVPLWQCAFFLIGAFLLVGVPVIEFINMRPQIWASDDFFVWTLIEEYTEMVAGTFFLAFHALILSGQMRALQKKL